MIHEKWLNDCENLDDNDDNDDEFSEFICDFVNFNILQLTFSIIQDKWADSDSQNAADISLLVKMNQAYEASEINSLSDKTFILLKKFLISETILNFHQMSFKILQQW